ncbi:PQQ-dependent sugar dehydrogenase [Nakamurella sp.]|uniref:PQQ-dependent sugar dehydrogenase n=1 Tax=Nakamurella sp. TaxID=1869182 RepID=UPI003B3BAB40
MLAAAVPLLLLGACTAPAPAGPAPSADVATGPTAAATTAPEAGELRVDTVATGLDSPWGLDFLPDGRAVVTSRDTGTISVVDATGTVTAVGTVEGVDAGGEGGLLGIAVSPGFATDRRLYVYYTAGPDNRIATVELVDGALTEQRVGFTGIPKAGIHNGGRLAFGPDGLLYVGTGDAGDRPLAQDPDAIGGKILRLTPDLRPAPDNPSAPPLAGGAGYDLGHRNVQGLAFDDRGRLWASEFGQNTWDELNLIRAGGNYGWPTVEGRADEGGGASAGPFVDPERVWPTDEASPSGIAVWRDAIWLAGLRGERLWQIPLTSGPGGSPTGEPVAHLDGQLGRLRTVAAAPDGSLWVVTSNTDGRGEVRDGDDRILRLTPG